MPSQPVYKDTPPPSDVFHIIFVLHHIPLHILRSTTENGPAETFETQNTMRLPSPVNFCFI